MKLTKIYEELNTESKILFNEVSAKSPCDCCKYFDWSFEQAGAYYGGLKHPIYHLIEKRVRHELRYVSPEGYIKAIAKGFGLSYKDATRAVNWDVVKEYAQDMRNGDKFPIGFYSDGNGSQEGRHRALAAMELGCNEIPVVVFSNVSNDEVIEFVNKHKDYSREDLNQVFVDKGYDGITDLDWREIRRYVEFRL